MDKNILTGYESTKIIKYDEVDEKFANAYNYDDLANQEIKGVLKANFHKDGKLLQIYSNGDCHTGIIAATRLGKTTSSIIPTILSFAKQKQKKSMFISDPKGELYRATAKTLQDEGYRIRLINFRDFKYSDYWNPLTPIYRAYRESLGLEKKVKVIKTPDGYRNEFNGKIYQNQIELDEDIAMYRRVLEEEVDAKIAAIALMLVPRNPTAKEPYWDDSARVLLEAHIWALLEDSNREINPVTEKQFSFASILSVADSIVDNDRSTYNDQGYFTNRNKKSRSYQLAKNCILENGNITRKCIISVFNTCLAAFKEASIGLVTRCNSFELEELIDESSPIAIFVDYRDEIKVHYKIVSLLVQNAYTMMIEYANQKPSGKFDAPFYFVLDEFGNFPQISDFDTTISACGGRNIFFMLVLQSYAQLANVYGEKTAEIIKDNLNMHIFFGSNNPATIREFSEECGKYTRISPKSALIGQGAEIENYQIETIDVMPRSDLQTLKVGECIITEALSGYVMLSKLERYFMTDEFKDLPISLYQDYKAPINPLAREYDYDVVFEEDDDDDW